MELGAWLSPFRCRYRPVIGMVSEPAAVKMKRNARVRARWEKLKKEGEGGSEGDREEERGGCEGGGERERGRLITMKREGGEERGGCEEEGEREREGGL